MGSQVELNKKNYPPVVSMVCADTNPDTTKCLSSLLTDEPIEFFSNLELHTAFIGAVHTSPYAMEGFGLIADLDDDVFPMATSKRKLCPLSAKERESILTPEILAKRRGISVELAQKTLAVNTHEVIRHVFIPSEQKVWKKAPWMNYLSIKAFSTLISSLARSSCSIILEVPSVQTEWVSAEERTPGHNHIFYSGRWSSPNFDLGHCS
jgi:hypothetical protein